MEQLSVGGDLFSTLAVVGLLVLFIGSLAYSYRVYAERKSAHESFDLALDIAEEIKNRVLAEPNAHGLIKLDPSRLEAYSALLAKQGVDLYVEIKSLEGELLMTCGTQRYPPPPSVSLPVAVARGQGSAELCELIVRVRR